ncbi:UNVERIFIED_CONTAM: hypothetical protein HDU68_004225 [Siphonaria sp. JEL0065]|nr:hypothetical protein HDU68_004225 [Siphonaria sp. JEL0065]
MKEKLVCVLTSTDRTYTSATEDMDVCVYGEGSVIRHMGRAVLNHQRAVDAMLPAGAMSFDGEVSVRGFAEEVNCDSNINHESGCILHHERNQRMLANIFVAVNLFAAGLVLAAEPTTFFTGTLMPKVYPRNSGWAKGNAVKVYTFDNGLTGSITSGIDAAPIYTFRKDKDLMSTPLQFNLVGVAPGDAGYSDLWNVTLVTVSSGSLSSNVTSVEQLNALVASGAATLSYPSILVNCPVVHKDSTLEVAADGKIVTGYYNNQFIRYFDFGPNGAAPGNNHLQPVYVIKDSTGSAEVGNHVFPGSHLDAGYTAFWYVDVVTAPAGYVADTFKASSDFGTAMQTVVAPLKIVNCPIVDVVANMKPATTTATPATSSKSSAGRVVVGLGLVLVALLV